jgi:homoserine/homoserine lactone efflux protein
MTAELYIAFILASLVLVIVPGPTVSLIVANSLRHGSGAGFKNVIGTQAGLAFMLAIAGIGLTSLIAALGEWFDWLRLAGVLYLVYLGWKMWRSADDLAGSIGSATAKAPRGGFFLQGFLVAISNPKMLFFFGAFFPQFLDPAQAQGPQIALMGATAMVLAALSDSAYAFLAGGLGRVLSKNRLKLLGRMSGACLIGGGLWLATQRSR